MLPVAALFLLTFQVQAQTSKKLSAPLLVPINNIFDAMRAHDDKKFKAQFTAKAILERANKKNEVEVSDLNKFALFIKQTPKHLDEQIFNISFNVSGNLASAWVPFAFYLDGKLSHCGVNSFQLVKQQSLWKIRYLMDNSFSGDCEAFIKQHKNQVISSKLSG